MTDRCRRALVVLVSVAAAAGAAGCGGDDSDSTSRADDAFSEVERQAPAEPDPDRAAPRWEPLAIVEGGGTASKQFEVAPDAVNWRARWRCSTGSLSLSVDPPPDDGNPLHRARCPDRDAIESIQTGRLTLTVDGDGPWRVSVSQQVTTRLDEPPLPAMTAPSAERVARGRFYGVERRGAGTAELILLAGGRLALRLEGFRTSANSDLFVWLSEADRPRTTKQALRAPHRQIAALKSTVGDQNYLLPADVDERSVRSIVIWCEPVRIAYAAATLTP